MGLSSEKCRALARSLHPNLSVLALTTRRWRSEAAAARVARCILRADCKPEFESATCRSLSAMHTAARGPADQTSSACWSQPVHTGCHIVRRLQQCLFCGSYGQRIWTQGFRSCGGSLSGYRESSGSHGEGCLRGSLCRAPSTRLQDYLVFKVFNSSDLKRHRQANKCLTWASPRARRLEDVLGSTLYLDIPTIEAKAVLGCAPGMPLSSLEAWPAPL